MEGLVPSRGNRGLSPAPAAALEHPSPPRGCWAGSRLLVLPKFLTVGGWSCFGDVELPNGSLGGCLVGAEWGLERKA